MHLCNLVFKILIQNRFYCRKGGLLLNNLLGIGGGCLMWLTMTSRSYEILIVGRFIIGVHCGEDYFHVLFSVI